MQLQRGRQLPSSEAGRQGKVRRQGKRSSWTGDSIMVVSCLKREREMRGTEGHPEKKGKAGKEGINYEISLFP